MKQGRDFRLLWPSLQTVDRHGRRVEAYHLTHDEGTFPFPPHVITFFNFSLRSLVFSALPASHAPVAAMLRCRPSPTRCAAPHESSGAPPAPLPPRRALLLHGAALLLASSSRLLAAPLPARAAAAPPDEEDIRDAVASAFVDCIPPARAPAVLRLAFHDAGTYRVATQDGGPNGSVALELARPESAGLKRGLAPVLAAQDKLRNGPAAELSLADLIQLAGAHAVALTGGPLILIPIGRVDSGLPDPEGRMPPETADGPALRASFAAAGLSTRELVALSGAHTIGGKGFGAPLSFDNSYFKTLVAKPWADGTSTADARAMASHVGLPSDKALSEDAPCLEWIRVYAGDEGAWKRDFAAAFVKMGVLGARWGAGVAPPQVVDLA